MHQKIYLLHGWTYDLSRWQSFLDELKRNGYQAKLLAVPGLTTPVNRPYTVEDYVDWLKQTLAKEQGKYILLGHSNGGRLAMRYAIAYPEQISQLVLIDSAGIYHNEINLRIKRTLFGIMAKLGKFMTSSPRLRWVFYALLGARDYRDAPLHMRTTMTNLLTSDQSLHPDQIRVPTTIIWGEQDTITTLRDGKTLHALIPNSEFYPIRNAGHAPQYTHVQDVISLITRQQ